MKKIWKNYTKIEQISLKGVKRNKSPIFDPLQKRKISNLDQKIMNYPNKNLEISSNIQKITPSKKKETPKGKLIGVKILKLVF